MAPRLKSETREPTTAPNHQGSSPEVHKTILRPCDDPLVRIPDVCYFDHCSGYPDPRCRAYRAISGIKSGNFIEKLYTDPLWTMYPHQEHKTDPKTTGNRLGAAPGCSSKIPDFPLFERCFPIRISPTFFFFGAGFHKVPDVGSSNGLAHSIRILILPRYSSPWDGFEPGATSHKK